MGRIFNATGTPIPIQKAASNKPLDDRNTVGQLADLFDSATWDGKSYHGMIVSVVNDGTKNGVYMLQRGTHYMYQSFDPSEQHYDATKHGWIKVNHECDHTVVDETLIITQN